jgi:hypothetical protein
MIEARAPEMMIPVEGSFAEWRKDPKYVAAYALLEDEFARAASAKRPRISIEPTPSR